ncbi:Endo-1,4-beta-xylanase A precursor [compost metagenome]
MTLRALKAAGDWTPAAIPAAAINSFTDYNSISGYAADDIAALAAAGFIKGDAKQQMNPAAPSTRAEAAVLIYRILMQD